MANFKQVNAAVKAKFPNVDVTVVRGVGYVYFSTGESFVEPQSIVCHPVNTSTEDLTKWCIEQVEDWLPKLEESKAIVEAAKKSNAEHKAAQPFAEGVAPSYSRGDAEIPKVSDVWKNGVTMHSMAAQHKQKVAIPKKHRNMKKTATKANQYTPAQHEAIKAIIAHYMKGIGEKGRHNSHYTYGGKTLDNAVFIPVRHLDVLCGLEPINRNG